MFGFLISGLNLTLSTLLPTFLTYKALSLPASQQTATVLHPWLTYWITNSLVLAFPRILPFDSYLRLGVHIYLLVPGRAEDVYQTYVRPWLQDHESQIEGYVERIYIQGRDKVWDVVRSLREFVVGTVLGDGEAVRRKQAEEEEKRRAFETQQRLGVGFAQSLLARFSYESREVQGRARPAFGLGSGNASGPAGGEQTLSAKLGDFVSAAAAVGVDKLQSAVAASGASGSGEAQNLAASSHSLFSSQTGPGQSTGLSKSRSEVDFEKIEQEEAPIADHLPKQQSGSSWGGWLWSDKSNTAAQSAVGRDKKTS